MWLLILEALLALALLVGIVAWTMSGRRREPPGGHGDERVANAAEAGKTEPAARAGQAAEPPDRQGG